MVKVLTGVLEVHVLAVKSVPQAVRHDLQLHDLLAYCHVRFGDVDFHFRVADLAGEAVAHHLGKVPGTGEHFSLHVNHNVTKVLQLLDTGNWTQMKAR